jgi:hypothetical protein
MDMDRRSFLTGGLACAGLAVLPGKYSVAGFDSADDLAAIFGLHPFTVSLLERVAGARSAVDRPKVERFRPRDTCSPRPCGYRACTLPSSQSTLQNAAVPSRLKAWDLLIPYRGL